MPRPFPSAGLLPRIAAGCARRRWLVVSLWAAALLAGIASAPALFGGLSSDVGRIRGSESWTAAAQLRAAAPSGGTITAVLDGRPVSDPATRPDVERLADQLRALPGVSTVSTPWSGGDARMVSADRNAVAVSVAFGPGPAGRAAVQRAASLLRAFPAPRVLVGGGPLQDREMNDQAARDLARAEQLSMPVALVLLVVLFGGVVAAGIPLLIALAGMGVTLLALLVASTVTQVSVYAVNVVTMLGLGLAVDYALLVVSRYREERGADRSAHEEVLRRTFATAGRTVAFSGMTVSASLAGLLVFPDDFLRSMGAAGMSVVLLDLLAALTLLPALLALLGGRIKPRRAASGERGALVGIARSARRRPVPVIALVCGLLVVAAVPFLHVRFADPDARSLPASSASRQLAETASARFGADAGVPPVTVVAQRPLGTAEASGYRAQLSALPGVRSVTLRPAVPGYTVLDVLPDGPTQGAVAMRLVERIRQAPAPARVLVGGPAATLTDYQDALRDRLPWMVAVIAVATVALLFLFTGSLVVPLKALALDVVSLGASFGALVWVFQDGHLGRLVGTPALGSLSVSTPVLVLAIAFGLSMDYEVFLLGRIAEVHRATGDTDLAVERGLQRTGGIVTAAAVLIVLVFAGFVVGGFSPVKQVGLGLVVAVAVDATLVRLLLVPAVMTLMGERNWWSPAPLRRLHARIGLTEDDGSSAPAALHQRMPSTA